MAATLISTIALLAPALSRAPRTRIQLSTISRTNAGMLKIAPVALPSTNTGLENAAGKWKPNSVIQQIVEVGAEADRDRHVGHRVFQNQVPADDPREDFAQRRVGVRVRAPATGIMEASSA